MVISSVSKDMVRLSSPIEIIIKETFLMDSCMDKASSYGRVVSSTRDPLWTMQLQVSVSTNGLMEAGIRASYWTEKDTRKASTTVKRTSLNTTVSGNMESDMGMATLSSTNKLPTKANSAKVSGTERAKWNTHQATYTKANGKMANKKVKEPTHTQTAPKRKAKGKLASLLVGDLK